MEAHCPSYIQRSSESGVSGALSSSLSAYFSTFEEKYPSLPNFQLPYMPWELNANHMAFYSSSPCDDWAVGHMFSSSPGFSSELCYFPYEIHSRDSPFLSQLSTPGSIMLQSPPLNNYGSCFTDPSQDFFDYSVNTPIEVGRNNNGCSIPSEDHSERIDWTDWEDQQINDDDSLASNWNNLFGDSKVEDPQPKVMESSTKFLAPHPQLPQNIPTPSWQSSCAINSTSSSSGKSKQRMRWTPELHEAFVEAVHKLEVSGKATAKNVMNLLKAEGLTGLTTLTIDHVRSHLQKYRAATNSTSEPEPLEGYSETRLAPIQEDSSPEWKTGSDITQALRVQWGLQKCLHEQLKNHKKLQLQVEQHGKILQKMLFECQGASTSSFVNLSPQRRHEILSSLYKNELGTSWVENEVLRENDGVIGTTASERVSRNLGAKQKAPETEAYDNLQKMLQGQAPEPEPQSKRKRMKGPLIPQTN